MPIPQFHRTPKTRKRKSRRAQPPQQEADPPVQAANEPTLSEEEVPALLASWPPRSDDTP